jgi:putative permease
MVPLLVYFFLMDKHEILTWLGSRFIPTHHTVLTTVWKDLHKQIANYLRGRVIEAFIVMVVTYIAFAILGLQYALLLAALVGISVFIPYIGVIVVTVPVLIVGVLQWGFTEHLWTLLIVYAVIVTLDGNLLMPLLFSGAVSLHPIAIILAILVFGGIWGIGGMFFAIPLAALVKALIENWPVTKISDK